MATAAAAPTTTRGKPAPTSADLPGDVRWVLYYLATKTGLRLDVLTAWYMAEGGPRGNPLNVRNPSTGRFDALGGNPMQVAQRTLSVINQSNMGAIRQSARTNNAQAQLHAIAASPWDAGHYGGDGRNLRGAYNRLMHSGPGGGITGALAGPGGAIRGAESAAAGALDVGSWVGGLTSWAENKATLALLYLTFTALAIAFLVLGGVRAFGGGLPGRSYRPPNLQSQDIPF